METIEVQVAIKIDETATTALVKLLAPAIKRAIGDSPDDIDSGTMRRLRASQNANFRGQKPPEDLGLLVDAKETAKLLNVSPRKLWGMYNSQQMPAPMRIGRTLRWSIEALKKWIEAGCPNQSADTK